MASDLIQCLSSTLSPDPNTRIAAELRLSELSKSPESGLGLSQIILAHDVDMSLRQHSASIVLRKYVKEHWSPYFTSFRGNAPSVEIKDQIRQTVFRGLSDPQRKIRSSCAHTISEIASCDWPDEYPTLLSSLLSLLSSGSPDSVHGAMRVFTEFVRNDLSEDQLLPVMRELVPVLLNVLGDSQHSTHTRAGTISVFRQCIAALYMVKDQHPTAVQEATASIIPVWLEAFKVLLNLDVAAEVSGDNWDGLTIRKEVYKTLDMLNTSFPRTLKPYVPAFLSASISHLQSLAPTFSQYYLSSSPPPIPTSSEDDTVLDLMHLVCPIFDFVGSSAKGGGARDWLQGDNLAGLVGAVAWWVQITKEDEESWESNANAFVAQEYDESQQYSVRVAGFDLLSVLIDRAPALVTSTLQLNTDRAVAEARSKREAGNSDWWRPLEASLAVTGSQSEAVLTCIEDELDSGRDKPINIEYLLSDVVPSFLGLNECPFLQGRGFVFASQFARLLPAQMTGSYLDAAIQVLETGNAGIPIKISAVKAIHNFCQNTAGSTLTPLGPRISKALGPFLLVTSEDTLSLVLEALSVVLEIDGDWMTQDLASDIVGAVLDVWTKNVKDPIFISIIGNVLETLTSSPSAGVYETVVKRALSPLSQALNNAKAEESWIASSALELLGGLVEGADAEKGLGAGFVPAIGPPLFKCLSTAEDRDVLQNGVSALTLIIRKDCNQLLGWTDPNTGQTGLASILALVAKLLRNESESGGLFVGDLIIHLMRRAGDAVLPILPDLLQALLQRMGEAKTASFVQSLVIPFTFLIHNQRDTFLNLLESSNVDGTSGLNVFIKTFCENAETFQGFWPSRVSTLALCSLFASERPTLQNLVVKGDIIVKPETNRVIMTRSRTKKSTPTPPAPHEFTSIPFPLKALKMLIHEIQSDGEAAAISAYAGNQGAAEVDSDDGDEDWTEEEKLNQGFKSDEFAMLSELLGPKGMAFDNDDVLDDDADDEDLKNDPISQMDMQSHLVSFFKECAARNTNNFSSLVDQLTPEETLVLRQLLA